MPCRTSPRSRSSGFFPVSAQRIPRWQPQAAEKERLLQPGSVARHRSSQWRRVSAAHGWFRDADAADICCGRGQMRITYIGHATLLLEIGGARILTDPNFDA